MHAAAPLPLRAMKTAYGKVSRRDARWIYDFTSAIFIILISVRCVCARAHARAPVWPTFTANCPTNRPPPFFFTCRSSERNRTASSSYRAPFPFSLSFAHRAEYDTAVGGLITIIIANVAVHRRVMVCTGRVTSSRGMRERMSKKRIPPNGQFV